MLLVGLFVADGETDGDADMKEGPISVTLMSQQSVQSVGVLLQQHNPLQTLQTPPARLVITSQHMLHQGLLLKDKRVQIYMPVSVLRRFQNLQF